MSAVDLKLALVNEARIHIGISEVGGDNKGAWVETFQKAFDGVAQGEPWCVAFVCYCIKRVETAFSVPCGLKLSEHAMTLWNTNPAQRRTEPKPGLIAVWKKKGTTSGHVGIVSRVTKDEPVKFGTIEGNTGPGAGVEREGDGVYEKLRSMSPMGDMALLGFLEPWV